MSVMEQMTHFISGLKVKTRVFLGASVGGMLRAKTNEELKTLIENICQNKYRSNERLVKQKGIHAFLSNTTLLAHMEVLF